MSQSMNNLENAISEIYEDPNIKTELKENPKNYKITITARADAIKEKKKEIEELQEDIIFWQQRKINNIKNKYIRTKVNQIINNIECTIEKLKKEISERREEMDKYNEYEIEKKKLQEQNLSPDEYTKRIKELGERLKI